MVIGLPVHLDDKGQTMLVICLQFTLSKKAKLCILTRSKLYNNNLCVYKMLHFQYMCLRVINCVSVCVFYGCACMLKNTLCLFRVIHCEYVYFHYHYVGPIFDYLYMCIIIPLFAGQTQVFIMTLKPLFAGLHTRN